jgi:CTP synthase
MKLREIGIQPEILLCRSEKPIEAPLKKKIAMFTNVAADCVFSAEDVSSIYEVPLRFHAEGVDDKIGELLNIWTRAPELTGWERVVHLRKSPTTEVEIGLVGKYVDLVESYKSLNEALIHGGIGNDCRVNLHHIDSEEIEKRGADAMLAAMDGILVAPGFGSRGIEGKIEAVRYARERGVPFFGICLGMQMAVIEYARNVSGPQGRELDRDRSQDAASGRRLPARAAHDHGEGRDHAASARTRACSRRARRRPPRTARTRSPSATATGTRSTTTTGRRSRARAWSSRASRPTAGSSR